MDDQEFDVVVVGAGTAGCVLANRLSADPALSVVVLEAGGSDDDPRVSTPATSSALFGSDLDWDYRTEPSAAVRDRELSWPRGKVLGGSSSINGMVHLRGNRVDYDGWAAAGNRGWGYDDVLPCFRRSEDHELGPSALHGAGGPQRVESLRSVHPITDALVDGFVSLGHPRNDDFDGEQQEGFGRFRVTQRGGQRWSAADGLRPALRRANLTVLTGARVTRLLLEGGRAIGVEVARDGSAPRRVLARRGVVLAAGSVASPQLLMLSGVGPREHLESVGVPVVHDLPGVGADLRDQVYVPVTYATTARTMVHAGDADQVALYAQRREGMLTSNLTEGGGFVRSRPGLDAPDLEFMLGAFGAPDAEQLTVLCGLLDTASRGRIMLRSADSAEAPRIEAGYLEAPEDVERLVAAIDLARRAVASPALDPFRGDEVAPGPQVTTPEALEEFVRATAVSFYHQVGTCRMGHDERAVVDDRLAVHGLEHLWVADASVMPTLPHGHPGAATMMIAERAADLLASR